MTVATVAPGVRLVPTPAHSPGHSAFRLSSSSGAENLADPHRMPGLVASRPAAVHAAHDLAGRHTPPPGLPTSVPAPIHGSELR